MAVECDRLTIARKRMENAINDFTGNSTAENLEAVNCQLVVLRQDLYTARRNRKIDTTEELSTFDYYLSVYHNYREVLKNATQEKI